MDRIEIKTTENQLRQEFILGYRYPPRIADALVNIIENLKMVWSHLYYQEHYLDQ